MPSMSHSTEDSQDHRSDEEIILGVDTHRDNHVASVITILGVLVATATFPTTTAGYRELLGWARSFGVLCRAGVEGTGSYGAALARHLRRQHIAVIEVNRPDRAARRRHGKSDTVDATAAAHAVLSARATGTAKTGDGPVEMLRLFHLATASAVKSRTQAINQLKAVIIGADPALARHPDRAEPHHPAPALRQPAGGVPDGHSHHHPLHPAPPGPAHPSLDRRSPRPATPHHRRAEHPRPAAAAPSRHRPGQRRCPAHHRR
jgi:Transposase